MGRGAVRRTQRRLHIRLEVIRLFCGFDGREAVGLHSFIQSVLEHATQPVSITPLTSGYLPRADRVDGSNRFTFARFAVPRLCGYMGHAIFLDGADMLMRCDIAELDALFDPRYAVQCVKHDYQTKHPRKYLGTSMESPNFNYERKNWASAFIADCSAPEWQRASNDRETLQFRFIEDRRIGSLPAVWNWLADEHGPSNDAKVLHWTSGIPAFPAHAKVAHADEWFATRDRAMTATG